MRTPVLLLTALVAGAASADEVFLKSGGQLSGRIVSRTPTEITVDVGAGRITIAPAQVARIEEGRSPLHEYEDKAGRLGPADAAGWLALGDWASARGLGMQAREAYTRALSAAPDDPRANAALGRVQVDGRWVSEDEGYRARGFVQYQGDWIPAAEYEAVQREQAAEEGREREREASEASAREAEARVQEADARAREAAEQQAVPFWYGWGPGPSAWSTATIAIRQPGVGPAWRR
jgi:hypothetical protein